jgi:hypothetical protein
MHEIFIICVIQSCMKYLIFVIQSCMKYLLFMIQSFVQSNNLYNLIIRIIQSFGAIQLVV